MLHLCFTYASCMLPCFVMSLFFFVSCISRVVQQFMLHLCFPYASIMLHLCFNYASLILFMCLCVSCIFSRVCSACHASLMLHLCFTDASISATYVSLMLHL